MAQLLRKLTDINDKYARKLVPKKILTSKSPLEQLHGILVPIHNANHWYIVVVDFKVKKFIIFDSIRGSDLRGSDPQHYTVVIQALQTMFAFLPDFS